MLTIAMFTECLTWYTFVTAYVFAKVKLPIEKRLSPKQMCKNENKLEANWLEH
jgi:hypothetical protein